MPASGERQSLSSVQREILRGTGPWNPILDTERQGWGTRLLNIVKSMPKERMNFLGRVLTMATLVGSVFAQQPNQHKRSKLTLDKTYLSVSTQEQTSEVHYPFGTLFLTCAKGAVTCRPLSSGRTYEWEELPRTKWLDGVAMYADPDCGGMESAFLPQDYHCIRIYNGGKLAAVYVAHLIRKTQPVPPSTLAEELEH
jgi:hypothetical protein